MSMKKRSYRKCLSSHGLIYLAGKELEISVRNLSITGLLAELDANACGIDISDIFHSIETSATIDLYLPEMRLAGEADVVRSEKIEGHIYIALEFRNLSYDVNNLLYKRKAYRKTLSASGAIVFKGQSYGFLTKNVSIDGLMIFLKEKLSVKPGTVTTFDFSQLNLEGEVRVIWVENVDDGSTLMGLQYVQMVREQIKGVPGFISDR